MLTDYEYQVSGQEDTSLLVTTGIPQSISFKRSRRVKIALSFDFGPVSHWLGTGCHPDNNMADYSSGIFAGQVGAVRHLDLLKKYNISTKSRGRFLAIRSRHFLRQLKQLLTLVLKLVFTGIT